METTPMTTTGDDVVEGWKGIASVLRVCERTAQRYATREQNPLPVYGRRRWAKRSEVVRWAKREGLAAGAVA